MTIFRKIFLLFFAAVLLEPSAAIPATQYTYDEAGRLIKVVYDNGKGIRYFYDEADNRQGVAIDDATSLPTDPPPPPVPTGGVIVVPLNGFTVIPLN